jgi:transcriptional regulator with XRE-family HTH domain
MQPTEVHAEEQDPTYDHDLLGPQLEEIQFQFVTLLDRVQTLSSQQRRNQSLEEAGMFLKRALSCISITSEDDSGEWLNEIDWKAFGQRLVQRRDAVKMQQKELAVAVGVSSQTIRNIESAFKRPGRDLLLRLLAVPELKLRVSDITGEHKATLVPTLWMAPHYDPHKMATSMFGKLNGTGDSLEQSTAYLDSRSTVDWLAISSDQAS